MSHPSTETLSAFIDSELRESERRNVAAHLERCDDCKQKWQALSTVVADLKRIEKTAVPAELHQQIQRRIALEPGDETLTRRLEARRQRFEGLRPGVGLGFALVFALAGVVYLFAWALDRDTPPDGVVVVPPDAFSLLEIGGREFRWHEGHWHEVGAADVDVEVVEASTPEAESLRQRYGWLDELLTETAGSESPRGVLLLDGERSVLLRARGDDETPGSS